MKGLMGLGFLMMMRITCKVFCSCSVCHWHHHLCVPHVIAAAAEPAASATGACTSTAVCAASSLARRGAHGVVAWRQPHALPTR